jgi:multidrug resistance efflux pump
MRHSAILNLADCTEFRQTLQARPPRIVHGTALLLAALLGAVLVWVSLTTADLVVRAQGRLRPLSTPYKVFAPVPAEVPGAAWRVVEVRCREGDEVREGDVLVRLDTERLERAIARRKREIQEGEGELAELVRLEELAARQAEAARARAQAELDGALEEVRQAKARQAADVRQAQRDLDDAVRKERTLLRLVEGRAAARVELDEVVSRRHEAQEKLGKARLPVDEGRVAVLRRALAQAAEEDAVRRQELVVRRDRRRGEVDTARMELAHLERERKPAVLLAPRDGVVTLGDVKVGDVLEAGKAVLEVAEQKGFRFEVLVPSEEVGHLQVGLAARIKLDAYDYQKYGTLEGTVSFISPDSGTTQGQQPADSSAGVLASQGQQPAVYLVRIDVAGDAVGRGSFRGQVKLGLAGQVEVVTGRESLLWLLLKKVRRSISLG